MRKILVTLALLVSALYTLSAIPAYPGKIRVKQPDGSTIIIQIHGDEWLHYITDEYGRVVAQDADGFYRPAQKPTQEEQEEAAQMRRAARQMRAQAAQSLTQGRHRIPVVLVNFSDKSFIINDPATAFSNMLNKEGYSTNGATGSVRDYYYENSHGAYEPVFEVYGPVTLSKTSEYYAYNKTSRAKEALKDACELLDDETMAFLTDDEKERARAYIMSLPDEDGVLHLDFHTGNVLVDKDGTCTVIDWMTAARGNRAVEVAMMEFLFSEAELFPEASKVQLIFFAAVRGFIGKQFFKEYQRLTPITGAEIDRYRLPALMVRRSWNIEFERPYLTRTIRELIAKYGK